MSANSADLNSNTSQPFVLHTRIVNGMGGGPEKTILSSPSHLKRLGYRSACLYLHPENDPGISNLASRADLMEAEFLGWVDGKAIDFGLVSRLAELCKQRNVAVWHAHDYKTNLLGIMVRRKWPMKLVTTTHGWIGKSGIAGLRPWLYNTVGKGCLRFYDAVVCVSQDLYANSLKWGSRENKTHLIQNAIDTEYYCRRISRETAKQQFGIGEGCFLIAGLGRLSPEKGFNILIDSVARLRQQGTPVVCVIGGEGPCRQSLTEQIERLSLQEHVHLLGHLNDPQLMLQAADLFVLSSLSEGLPNVVLEAMALKTPVVATRVAGVPNLIEHDVEGLLVNCNHAAELADAILSVKKSEALQHRFAQAGRAKIENEFDFGKRMANMARVYDDLLGITKETENQ